MAAEADGTEISQVSARDLGDQLLHRLLRHLLDSVPGTVGAGLNLVNGAGSRSVSAVGVAACLDPLQWARGEGPLIDAVHARASEQRPLLVLPDGDTDFDVARWPGLVDALDAEGIARPTGVVITAGEWGSELPVIFSVYTDVVPDTVLVSALDRFEGLLASALLVVEYCVGEEVRAEQMLQMVQYRRVIEQAKGLVMAATQADAAAAFTTLARASQHFNTRLRNLAIALVEHVGGSPAEGPEDPTQVVVPTSGDRRTAVQVWAALTRTVPQQSPPA